MRPAAPDLVWQNVCDELHGRIVDGPAWADECVAIAHGPWTIAVDAPVIMAHEVAVSRLRLRARYADPHALRLAAYRYGPLGLIAHWLGAQDILTGDAAFDHTIVLQGNDEPRIRELFADAALRAALLALPNPRLQALPAHDPPAAGIGELRLTEFSEVRAGTSARRHVDVLAAVLDRMATLGLATPAP